MENEKLEHPMKIKNMKNVRVYRIYGFKGEEQAEKISLELGRVPIKNGRVRTWIAAIIESSEEFSIMKKFIESYKGTINMEIEMIDSRINYQVEKWFVVKINPNLTQDPKSERLDAFKSRMRIEDFAIGYNAYVLWTDEMKSVNAGIIQLANIVGDRKKVEEFLHP